MALTSEKLLSRARELLEPLDRVFVFVGGATVHLHVDDPAAAPVRTTKDVDVVVAATTYVEFSEVEEGLRDHGFEQITGEEGPICRWTKNGLILDVLPTRPEVIGFGESRWFREGFQSAVPHELPDGQILYVFDVLHLLAAKIEAFRDRGNGDLLASRDFEDIATLLDGNRRVWQEMEAQSQVALFVRTWLSNLDKNDFEDALAGHVGGYDRARLILERIRRIGSV